MYFQQCLFLNIPKCFKWLTICHNSYRLVLFVSFTFPFRVFFFSFSHFFWAIHYTRVLLVFLSLYFFTLKIIWIICFDFCYVSMFMFYCILHLCLQKIHWMFWNEFSLFSIKLSSTQIMTIKWFSNPILFPCLHFNRRNFNEIHFWINFLILSVWNVYREGDISLIEADAITNTTDETLTEKNTISNRVFLRAGADLYEEILNDNRGTK